MVWMHENENHAWSMPFKFFILWMYFFSITSIQYRKMVIYFCFSNVEPVFHLDVCIVLIYLKWMLIWFKWIQWMLSICLTVHPHQIRHCLIISQAYIRFVECLEELPSVYKMARNHFVIVHAHLASVVCGWFLRISCESAPQLRSLLFLFFINNKSSSEVRGPHMGGIKATSVHSFLCVVNVQPLLRPQIRLMAH